MKPQFQQTQWSRVLVGTLAKTGVKHAVVSPGSRSTPLLAALLDEHEVRVHSIIDERSAGFVGVGLARSTEQPVLLLCTSGTAAANYLPAVVEADESRVPLVVLTADRPIDAQNARSPQTTDQTQLYGNHVRKYLELGEAPSTIDALRSFRRLLMSAVLTATSPIPGPVHLNARARKPLQPCEAADDDERAFQTAVAELLPDNPPRVITADASPSSELVHQLANHFTCTRSGLIVCGYDSETPPLDPDALAQFARVTGYPVWIDVTHPLRWNHPGVLADFLIRCADLLWASEQFRAKFTPELVVQVGPMPTSSHWEDWLGSVRTQWHFVLARQGWPDPSGRANVVITGNPSLALQGFSQAIEVCGHPPLAESPWFLEWRHVDTRVGRALSSWAAKSELRSELHAVRAILEACPRGTCVVLGNSLPVREAGIVWPAVDKDLSSFAIRGANGIDGVVSTAVGVARGGRRPVLALLGDVSFLHDVGALYAARDTNNPMAIVVIDNQGGRIFEQLPVSTCIEPERLVHWTTPHTLDLAAAGAVYDIQTSVPTDIESLKIQVKIALASPGAKLIVVRVDPSSARTGASSLAKAIEEAIESPGDL